MAPFNEAQQGSAWSLPAFHDYLRQQSGVVFTDEDREYAAVVDSVNLLGRRGQMPDSLFIVALRSKNEAFMAKYEDEYYAGYEEYIDRLIPKQQIDEWRMVDRRTDSVYYEVLGLSPSLVYDIRKVRTVQSKLDSEKLLDYCRVVSDAVHHPFLKDEVWRMYAGTLPKAGSENEGGYTLPGGRATDALKAITDPFLGNLVLVDFWGTGCGPCVSHIQGDKEQRAKLEAEGALTYVFITDDSWSYSKERHDQFVEEQGLTNAFRLTVDDMNRFMQLFKFSSLPHYVLLGRDGRVLDDDFSPYGDMKLLLEKYNK
jgi:thiol-disulfide isomerase/thioredoxin